MASKTRSARRTKQRELVEEVTQLAVAQGVIVTTSRGHNVMCLPIAPLLEEVREAHERKKPPIPTYTITDVAGSEMVIAHNDTSIADENTPEEDKEKWAEYKAQVAEIDAELNEATMRAVAVKGIRILTMPPEEEWLAEHEFLGLTVPEKKPERQYHFFKTEVIGTLDDGLNIVAGIYRASGYDEEVLSQIEGSFRSSLGEQERADAGADQETTGEEEPATE